MSFAYRRHLRDTRLDTHTHTQRYRHTETYIHTYTDITVNTDRHKYSPFLKYRTPRLLTVHTKSNQLKDKCKIKDTANRSSIICIDNKL